MKTICIIPARYASSRLPGKPLAKIGDKPMIQWVYERANKAKRIDRVLVATDDARIKSTVESFGGEVVLTDPGLPSGTDRVAAACRNADADVVLNLQGDEPFVEPQLLDALTAVFDDQSIQMATPVKQAQTLDELEDPALVRVLIDSGGRAIYFSRAVIPFIRDVANREAWLESHKYYIHIGIYAYRKPFLEKITRLPQSPLEKAEKLEQLRVIENGYAIHTIETDYASVSVDTADDLKKVNDLLNKNQIKLD